MPTLFVVPTPIGNLKDITLRALEVLRDVPVILSEDTRVTKKLLNLLNIDTSQKQFISFYDQVDIKKIPKVLGILHDRLDIALVSDAGTPVISDPGYKLIKHIAVNHPVIKIEVLPGPTSITTALVASGFPPDKFTFVGYMPRKPGGRKKLLKAMQSSHGHIKSTYIAFESPHRVVKTLEAVNEQFQDKVYICLCWELTKKFERVMRGSAKDLLEKLVCGDKKTLKGEVVLLLSFKNSSAF